MGYEGRRLARRGARRRRAEERRTAARDGAGGRGAALRALTSGALALPGLANTAVADSPLAGVSAEYSYGRYQEDKIPASKVAGGSRERYEIDIHQARLAGPVGDRLGLVLDVVHETMSGATPWFIVPDADGKPLQVMTGATVEDSRTDLSLSGSYAYDWGEASAGGGLSFEKDYLAVSGNVGGVMNFNEKNTTLSGGFGVSVDKIVPTDPGADPFRPTKEYKQSYSFSAGLSQILDQKSLLQSNLVYKYSTGYLSDPYKQVLVAPLGIVGDRRPDTRNQIALLTRYRRHFSEYFATLHADYRFGWDDWGIMSHAFEIAWYQDLYDFARLIPSLRYYSQGEADFYRPYFLTTPANDLYSSDYRLSGFGALAGRLKLEIPFELWRTRWKASLSGERYVSDADLALDRVSQANPGLISFYVFSAGLSVDF
jgi:hypothetical protein